MSAYKFDLQLFAEENMIKSGDLEPGISMDYVTRLTGNIQELQKLLGVTEMTPMPVGNTIKIYNSQVTNVPEQVAEGEVIPLTKVERKLVKTIEIDLQLHRWETTLKNIQRVGKDRAINESDKTVIGRIQKSIKERFYDALLAGTGEASGTTLQEALANAWVKLAEFYEDIDATPIYFVSTKDIGEYLGGKTVNNVEQAFGFAYLENFLGLGTVVISPKLPKGTLIATAKENINGAYPPANSGDVATSYGLTSDRTGLIGMKHYTAEDHGAVGSFAMEGVTFYPELSDGIIVTTIEPAGA